MLHTFYTMLIPNVNPFSLFVLTALMDCTFHHTEMGRPGPGVDKYILLLLGQLSTECISEANGRRGGWGTSALSPLFASRKFTHMVFVDRGRGRIESACFVRGCCKCSAKNCRYNDKLYASCRVDTWTCALAVFVQCCHDAT